MKNQRGVNIAQVEVDLMRVRKRPHTCRIRLKLWNTECHTISATRIQRPEQSSEWYRKFLPVFWFHTYMYINGNECMMRASYNKSKFGEILISWWKCPVPGERMWAHGLLVRPLLTAHIGAFVSYWKFSKFKSLHGMGFDVAMRNNLRRCLV